ncbi:Response regulator receiver domain-containing protein [Halomicrobium zhouii]|uniref:Response regulator receiver domain-containing protein n=1 Tax=Halomicrobium zhouii TaxID=767519 RepID=A0A1I6KP08_9EURY|nr:HalX domain-containing protein [Halomicrobium zhouii]SFR92728.1 Response regulator receiver domain-containing protein [Halomicrobium zhouii]
MTTTNRSGRVLVVDDERAVADLYANWLEPDHDVQVAYDGNQALELATDDVDVVFLDRQMPGQSGDEVLEVLDERGFDCRIVMVTAVDPGFDIVEMPFDDYLIKPVTREALTESVADMLTRDTYDEQMQEYFALVSKKATLDAQKSRAELAESEAYAEITTRVDEFRNRVDETAAQVTSFEGLFYELPGGN